MQSSSSIEEYKDYSFAGVFIVGPKARLDELAGKCNKILEERWNVHITKKGKIFTAAESCAAFGSKKLYQEVAQTGKKNLKTVTKEKIKAFCNKIKSILKNEKVTIDNSECSSLDVLPLKKTLTEELNQLKEKILTEPMKDTLKGTFPENNEDGGIIDRSKYEFNKFDHNDLVTSVSAAYIAYLEKQKISSFDSLSFLVSIQPLVYFSALAGYNSTDVNLFGGEKEKKENSLQTAIRELEEEAAIRIRIEDQELLYTTDPPIDVTKNYKVCYILNVTNLKFEEEEDHVKVTE